MLVKKFVPLLLVLCAAVLSWGHHRDSTYRVPEPAIVIDKMPAEEKWIPEARDVLVEGMLPATTSNDSIQRYIDLARTLIAKVRETQNFITNIDQASKVDLPVGMSKTVGGITYDIAINAIRLKPAYAELDVFLQFNLPQNDQPLTFMARGIKFTKNAGIVGDAKLQLLGDYAINFNGDKTQLILKGTSSGQGTYAVMDCEGFRELSLDATIKFSRDLIRPEDAAGNVGLGNVETRFGVVINGWNDLVVQVNLPPFQVTGLNGVGFAVRDAVFDFSDVRNAPAVVFPSGYESTAFLADNNNLWRGFFLRELTVSLPPELNKRNASARTAFTATNVLIDNMGVTGTFSGTDLIALEQGDMNGWSFSLDSLGIELRANQIVRAGFDGGIVIPIGKEDQPFDYSAIISGGGNYTFNVSATHNMTFPLWKAGKVEIYDASYLEIKVQEKRFLPKANLHGRMTVTAGLSQGGQGVELANISFENLEIQSVQPYIKVGNFSFGSEALQQKMAGFPISIQDVGIKSLSDTELGLDFRLKLNLVGEDAGSFAADAGLTLIGNMDQGAGIQSWRYKDVRVNDINVDIDGGAFKIKGRLIFYRNDATYGDGFNGNVKAEFTPGIKVTGTAIFGNVSGYRYWYADAMVNFPTGIPIFTGVAIYGFGGGAYYGMKVDNTGAGSDLGRTQSGVVYVPYERGGLGLKAIVSLGSSPKPEAFNADVFFEIAFFKGGGVRYIAFGGNGYLITPGLDINLDKLKGAAGKMTGVVKDLEGKMSDATKGLVKADGGDNSLKQIFGDLGNAGNKGQISARVMISFDFENRVLHGDFEVFINVAGGIIKGIGPNGRAGWAVLHFAPGEWYVYVGTPDDRIGIGIGIGTIRVTATAYFMVGTKILGSPPPPPQVQNILKGKFDYMSDLNALGKGAGFGFGASLGVSTGNLSFLMFYGFFEAGVGFDIMLKDYGEVNCVGRSSPLGINGWYANGQVYAYFQGEIGIRVKIFGRRKSVSILQIGAAALLQAQLPNPMWLQGTVGGYFSVLNGLVKGNCKFQITLGEKCVIEKSAEDMLADIKVISEITPTPDETNVNVFNTPQAVFNMEVDKAFELVDMETETKRTFKIKLDHFKLTADQDIVGTTDWNDGRDVLAFNSYEILPPKKSLKATVQVSFEEKTDGRWNVVVADGKKVVQVLESVFTTGDAPDHIPLTNIEYSYPLIGQANFHRDEVPEGYIKLKKAQPYLFSPGTEWIQKGRFTAGNGSEVTFNFVYTYATNLVTFAIPTNLSLGQTQAFELVNLPATKDGAVDRNVKTVSGVVGSDTTRLNVELKTRDAEGTIQSLQEKAIFSTSFRSSQFATLQAKFDHQKIDGVLRLLRVPWYTHYLSAFLTQDEPFDKAELFGNAYTGDKPLITITADLRNNAYYNNDIFPLIYQGYPLDGDITVNRNTELMGLPPKKAVSIFQEPNDIEVVNGALTHNGFKALRYTYDLPYYMIADFRDIQTKVVARYLSKPDVSARMADIIAGSFPILREGTYIIVLQYRLPGRQQPHFEKPIDLILDLSRK